MFNPFYINMAAFTMESVGRSMMAEDKNTTGLDDAMGRMFLLGGGAAEKFAQGKPTGVNGYLALVRDELTAYLDTVAEDQVDTAQALGVKIPLLSQQ